MEIKRQCPICHKEVVGKARKKYCSYFCAAHIVIKAAKQLRAKKGPYYRKWLRATRSYRKIAKAAKNGSL